jgi:hypothetical protein
LLLDRDSSLIEMINSLFLVQKICVLYFFLLIL